ARAIRRTRQQVQQNELVESVRRLRPSTNLLNWDPRPGRANAPAIEDSLLDRLRRGDPVADSIGNVLTFYGIQNLILDPTMESVYPPAATSSVEAVWSRSLLGAPAWYVKDGGTSATGSFGVEYLRDDPIDNPYNSAAVRMRLTATGSGTHTLEVRSVNWAIVNFPVLPYLVGAVRVARLFNNTDTNVTSRKLILELYDQSSAVVRASNTVDLELNVPIDTQKQLVVSIPFAGESWESNNFQIRVRLELVTTGATGTAYFHIGEPQLILSYSPDPPPYTPNIASWHPIKVASYGRTDPDVVLEAAVTPESNARISILNSGTILWGSGSAAADTDLYRGTANQLKTTDTLYAVGGLTTDGTALLRGAVVFNSEVVSTVDADQNNYSPTNFASCSVLRFTSLTLTRTITGLAAASTDGRRVTVVNNTAQSLVLAHESASSTATNRFRCPNAANLTIRQQGAVDLMYVGSRWTVVAP
ncbi:MAG TPA: hypothetical protein VIU37_00195, partial [Candidatus Limnocylindrales bacterium]